MGFEPTVPVKEQRFSRPPRSATLAPLLPSPDAKAAGNASPFEPRRGKVAEAGVGCKGAARAGPAISSPHSSTASLRLLTHAFLRFFGPSGSRARRGFPQSMGLHGIRHYQTLSTSLSPSFLFVCPRGSRPGIHTIPSIYCYISGFRHNLSTRRS